MIARKTIWKQRNQTAAEYPDGLERIGTKAFAGCTSLKGIVLPDTVAFLGSKAFARNTSLTYVVLPERMSSLGHHAFDSCSRLAYVVVPEKTVFRGRGVFARCDRLRDAMVRSDGYINWDMFATRPGIVRIRLHRRHMRVNILTGTGM